MFRFFHAKSVEILFYFTFFFINCDALEITGLRTAISLSDAASVTLNDVSLFEVIFAGVSMAEIIG